MDINWDSISILPYLVCHFTFERVAYITQPCLNIPSIFCGNWRRNDILWDWSVNLNSMHNESLDCGSRHDIFFAIQKREIGKSINIVLISVVIQYAHYHNFWNAFWKHLIVVWFFLAQSFHGCLLFFTRLQCILYCIIAW